MATSAALVCLNMAVCTNELIWCNVIHGLKGKIAPPALFCFSLQKAALVVFSLKKCPRHFRDSLSSVPLKIHFECCELLDSMNY